MVSAVIAVIMAGLETIASVDSVLELTQLRLNQSMSSNVARPAVNGRFTVSGGDAGRSISKKILLAALARMSDAFWLSW
ncbi:Mlc transcriptional repressor of MalT (the transcriptional activator of maltose regulon) and manXYZ operon [Salmonella enterica subsp. enterica]|nr:Mlc transcriptional repressor of MalT (the transcriptional activator of maltose regulon) and manXYZ operon [Salmonella enterica subsp. enterica] [Salmonella enterica subsp. enterica serovar Menston]